MTDPMIAVNTATGEVLGDIVPEDKERKTANKDFVMLYRQFINQIADLGLDEPVALRVLLFLIRNMDTRNALAVPMTLLAEMVGVSRQTASQKIAYLRDNGWIAVYRLGRQNVYVVNPQVVWTAYGDEKAYCRIDAMIMLDSRDNWEFEGMDKRVNVRHIDQGVLRRLAEEGDAT